MPRDKLIAVLLELRQALHVVVDTVKKADTSDTERRLLLCSQLLNEAIDKAERG